MMFGLDYRSLALFRFSLGLMIAVDLIERMGHINAHYTDRGIIRRTLVLDDEVDSGLGIMIHALNGSYLFQLCLFIFHIIIALLFSIGYYTKIMSFLNWIMYVSLVKRNPIVNNGGDLLVCAVLFWMVFIPTGAVCNRLKFQN